MTFNFGTPQSSGFGGFGQSSTPAFGASSTPAFGASSTSAFGASSTPAFGASGTPAFGASSSLSTFAATSTPALGAKTQGAFSFPSTNTPAFGAAAPAFGQLAQSAQSQQQQQQAQQQQHQLSTKNNQPINDSTAWDDINEPSQQILLQLECVFNFLKCHAAHLPRPCMLEEFVYVNQRVPVSNHSFTHNIQCALFAGDASWTTETSARSSLPVSGCRKAKKQNR